VNSTGSSRARCVYSNNSSRLTARDTVFFCQGTGSDLIAVETNHPSATISMKTCTINGASSDILQTLGSIIIGATDLVNHAAPNGFTVAIQPASVYFGLLGFPGGNLTYYLPPTITPIASVSTTTPYVYSYIATYVAFAINITFSGSIAVGETVTFSIYKNNVLTPLTITLNDLSPSSVTLTGFGVTFLTTDTIDVRLTTVGNPNTGAILGKMLIY
jgi:hypothetical protein